MEETEKCGLSRNKRTPTGKYYLIFIDLIDNILEIKYQKNRINHGVGQVRKICVNFS